MCACGFHHRSVIKSLSHFAELLFAILCESPASSPPTPLLLKADDSSFCFTESRMIPCVSLASLLLTQNPSLNSFSLLLPGIWSVASQSFFSIGPLYLCVLCPRASHPLKNFISLYFFKCGSSLLLLNYKRVFSHSKHSFLPYHSPQLLPMQLPLDQLQILQIVA